MSDIWYRHKQTGDRGKRLDEGGVDSIRYDRPYGPTIPYKPNEWVIEDNRPPLNRTQLARIAFAADRQLLYFTQQFARSRRDWDALLDEERINWITNGPDSKDKDRVRLYKSIMGALDPLTKG